MHCTHGAHCDEDVEPLLRLCHEVENVLQTQASFALVVLLRIVEYNSLLEDVRLALGEVAPTSEGYQGSAVAHTWRDEQDEKTANAKGNEAVN